ncbi:MAG: helix-turn-helix domain-containing protein [Bacteroidetes bacterium]|nr:helix-turn-helix domain-containing protein [Bacteroidota bacterium]
MSIEVITKEDLQEFRVQLLNEFKKVLTEMVKPEPMKPWLRSKEVRKILNVSEGTLQNLRITGKINSSKIGTLHYYKREDIEKLFDEKRRL